VGCGFCVFFFVFWGWFLGVWVLGLVFRVLGFGVRGYGWKVRRCQKSGKGAWSAEEGGGEGETRRRNRSAIPLFSWPCWREIFSSSNCCTNVGNWTSWHFRHKKSSKKGLGCVLQAFLGRLGRGAQFFCWLCAALG